MESLLKLVLILTMVPGFGTQNPPSSTPQAAKPAQEEPKAEQAYRLSFVLYETEDGKRTNERSYIMLAKANFGNSLPPSVLKIGTRVPISTEDKKTTYIDVGLELRCALRELNTGKIQADFEIELSNVAAPEQAGSAQNFLPVLRRTTTSSWTYLTTGKPMIISSIDDLASKKRTVIEVTATRLD